MALIGQNKFNSLSTRLLYLTAFFSFFSGWFLVAVNYEWVRMNMPWLMRINTPWVDIVGAAMVLVFAVEWLWQKKKNGFTWEKGWWKNIPGELKWYLFFIASGAFSILFAYNREYGSSAWNWFRYIVFNYVAFLVVPYVLASKEKVLKNILHIWFVVGTLTALYGLVSLFVHDIFNNWTRVSPFPIFGWQPYGTNHNQLAEALVVILPIAFYFTLTAYKRKEEFFRFYLISTLGMSLVCLLTLSRAAWVCLFVQAGLAFIFMQKNLMEWGARHKTYVYSALVLGGLVAVYMFYFMATSNVVSSSNNARIEATKIVFYDLNRSPFFGFGPGAYMKILWDTRAYMMDFGDPLEAHGFVQKIVSEEGFVGLGFFVLFLAALFLHLWSAQRVQGGERMLARALFISAMGAVLFQAFNTEYYSAVMWLPLGISLAYARLRTSHIV